MDNVYAYIRNGGQVIKIRPKVTSGTGTTEFEAFNVDFIPTHNPVTIFSGSTAFGSISIEDNA